MKELIEHAPHLPALKDDESSEWMSYGDLYQAANTWRDKLTGPRSLVFIYTQNRIDTVAAILGAHLAGHVVALFDSKLSISLREVLEKAYMPEWIIDSGYPVSRIQQTASELNPYLAMLWSTSGSTGSPKLVRLTWESLLANAKGIAKVLDIKQYDVGAGYLPIHYSYGWSVLSSHLIQGARVCLTEQTLTDHDFWPTMKNQNVSHFPGVPFNYEVMSRFNFSKLDLPELRTMTQAGGNLALDIRKTLHDYMHSRGGKFYVMYGQTEAAPRMTTLDHNDFPYAPDSVGIPLPGCKIEIRNPDAEGWGDVTFYGPNVMQGYSQSRLDLQLGDEQKGCLLTGDIGRLDQLGRLVLAGRRGRDGKLFGLRINLDEVEKWVTPLGAGAVTLDESHLLLHIVKSNDYEADSRKSKEIIKQLQAKLAIPVSAYKVNLVEGIPRSSRGKIDYAALRLAR